MANSKDISRRIKSIGNIKKITKAMEMVSAAKMRRAVEAVQKSRPYVALSWQLAGKLTQAVSNEGDKLHPLLQRHTLKKIAIIVITANRGLCGGFNSALLAKIKNFLNQHTACQIDLIIMGKKAGNLGQTQARIIADFTKNDLASSRVEIQPIAQLVTKEFLAKNYQKVLVAYTDFVNPVKQVPRLRPLLPLGLAHKDYFLDRLNPGLDPSHEVQTTEANLAVDYLFEPSAKQVLNKLLTKLIEAHLYQALLESNASEQSARMNAMRQANDAANDMVDELTLSFNKARQAGITAEIAEISAGANALQ